MTKVILVFVFVSPRTYSLLRSQGQSLQNIFMDQSHESQILLVNIISTDVISNGEVWDPEIEVWL